MSCLRRREREVLVGRLRLNFNGVSVVSFLSFLFLEYRLDWGRTNYKSFFLSFFPSNENLTQSHTYMSFFFLVCRSGIIPKRGAKEVQRAKFCIPVM